jgi:hypothetical protein
MTNGWTEYSKLVLSKMDEHSAMLEKLSEQVSSNGRELEALKVKAGMWGALSASVISIGAYIASKIGG